MIEWEVADDHLRVVDAANAELSVRGPDLLVDGTGPDIPRPVDATVTATASELRFPHAIVYAFSLGREDRYELDPSGDPLSLSPGEYVVDVDTEIKTYLRFSGAATIRRTDDYATVVVSFPERCRVILGFRGRDELPIGTVTVPESPDGLATAITHMASSHKTDGPDRTYPTLRGHPPLLEFDDELDVPEAVSEEVPDVGIELLVPPRYEPLLVTAPLAYYLQATVRTADRETPALRVRGRTRDHELSALPALERDVERLLRRTFFLDCLVRNAGPYGTTLGESSLLDALSLSADRLYDASPADRLASYLEVPHAAIEHRLPEWHLSTYVDPTPENLSVLPYLLDRLSLLYLPRTSELEGRELVERSLDDFYRGGSGDPSGPGGSSGSDGPSDTGGTDVRAGAGQVASVDIVKPELKSGRIHGWLADGVPIDVFKSHPDAYENRLDYLERESEGTSIVVALNDPEMAGEHARVAEIYRDRSEQLPIEVTVEESLSTAELARAFEAEHDFIHYIGHCETTGLRCPDGHLSASNLSTCNAQTFFLNACGSFYEGMTLVEKGSVAGAVTFTKVLNEHAVKVGSTFARLLAHGFSIERAMRLARRRIMMGKDYAVVGDGTHTLIQGEHRSPTTATLDRLDEGFLLSLECFSSQGTGAYYFPHVENNEYAYLCGTESNFTLDREEVAAFLREMETPVIYDGDVYWSRELYSRFDA